MNYWTLLDHSTLTSIAMLLVPSTALLGEIRARLSRPIAATTAAGLDYRLELLRLALASGHNYCGRIFCCGNQS
jgi:hypothetical protein